MEDHTPLTKEQDLLRDVFSVLRTRVEHAERSMDDILSKPPYKTLAEVEERRMYIRGLLSEYCKNKPVHYL